jgi:hypothetical protein
LVGVGGSREPTLVDGDEGDDVAIGRRRLILVARNNPLQCLGPRRKKTALDETLHTGVDDVRAAPRLYEATETEE